MMLPTPPHDAGNPTGNPKRRGIVLFAHGSRDPLWKLPIEAVAQRLAQQQPAHAVACAYLELTTPDLMTVCTDMVAAGCMQVTVVPMFLGQGRHAREDLPLLVAALRERFPQLGITLQPAVGEDPRVLDLLAQIAGEVPAL
jgi:sirohydrochlorin cobaltochelatase